MNMFAKVRNAGRLMGRGERLPRTFVGVLPVLGLLVGASFVAVGSVSAQVQSFASSSPSGGSFVPVTPYRVADTRPNSGYQAAGQTLGAGQTLNVQVTGTASGDIPTGAAAAVLNVTAVDPTASGFLTLFPSGTSLPVVSNLDFVAGATVPNLVTVPLSASGGIAIYNHTGSTNVIVDAEGYYLSTAAANNSGLYNSLSPTRVLGNLQTGAAIGAGQTKTVTVAGTGAADGVPASASAVVVNVTAANGTAPSFLTVFPAGAPQPTASNLNFGAGQTIANRVTVGAGSAGQIALYNHAGTVNVDVDVDGYYTSSSGGTGGLFVPITPVRLTDTRVPLNGTPISSNTSETFNLSNASIPSSALAVAANLTVVAGDAPGYLTAYPTADTTVPVASDLNWTANEIVPNFTVADTAGTGRVAIFNSQGATSNLVIDAFGYFTATTNPTVTGVSPTGGPTVGGTSVTIAGTNFTGATAVDFGGAAATSFTVVSSTSITATSPAGSPGTVNVTVTTPRGTSVTNGVDQYTYVAVPTTLSVSAPSTTTAGATFSLTVTAKDANGNTATGYTGTVHFTSTDGAAVLPSNYTFTTADAGVHTFTGVALKTAGTQTITATDTVTASIAGTSGSIAVSAATAASFVVATPSPQTAGVPYSTSVTARDQYGNLTDITGTITVSGTALATSPSATTASESLGTFSNGVATLSVTSVDATTGAVLTVTNTGSVTGSSSTFAVSAATAASFVVAAPGTQVAGVQYSTSVTAKDAYGNLTNTVGTVTVSGTALTGSPNGTSASQSLGTFSNGVASLNVTSVDATTAAVLTVTNTASVTGSSSTFAVSAATADAGYVTTVTAGSGLTVGGETLTPSSGGSQTVSGTFVASSTYTFAIQAVDQYGNLFTGTGSVAFTFTAGTSTATATTTTPIAISSGVGSFTMSSGATVPSGSTGTSLKLGLTSPGTYYVTASLT